MQRLLLLLPPLLLLLLFQVFIKQTSAASMLLHPDNVEMLWRSSAGKSGRNLCDSNSTVTMASEPGQHYLAAVLKMPLLMTGLQTAKFKNNEISLWTSAEPVFIVGKQRRALECRNVQFEPFFNRKRTSGRGNLFSSCRNETENQSDDKLASFNCETWVRTLVLRAKTSNSTETMFTNVKLYFDLYAAESIKLDKKVVSDSWQTASQHSDGCFHRNSSHSSHSRLMSTAITLSTWDSVGDKAVYFVAKLTRLMFIHYVHLRINDVDHLPTRGRSLLLSTEVWTSRSEINFGADHCFGSKLHSIFKFVRANWGSDAALQLCGSTQVDWPMTESMLYVHCATSVRTLLLRRTMVDWPLKELFLHVVDIQLLAQRLNTDLQTQTVSDTCVSVTWKSATQYSSVTEYIVTCPSGETQRLQNVNGAVSCCNLQPASWHVMSVASRDGILQFNLRERTASAKPVLLRVKQVSELCHQIWWRPSSSSSSKAGKMKFILNCEGVTNSTNAVSPATCCLRARFQNKYAAITAAVLGFPDSPPTYTHLLMVLPAPAFVETNFASRGDCAFVSWKKQQHFGIAANFLVVNHLGIADFQSRAWTLCCSLKPAQTHGISVTTFADGYRKSNTTHISFSTGVPQIERIDYRHVNDTCVEVTWQIEETDDVIFELSCAPGRNATVGDTVALCCSLLPASQYNASITALVDGYPRGETAMFNIRTRMPEPKFQRRYQVNDSCVKFTWKVEYALPSHSYYRFHCDVNDYASYVELNQTSFVCCNLQPATTQQVRLSTIGRGIFHSSTIGLAFYSRVPAPRVHHTVQVNDSCVSVRWHTKTHLPLRFRIRCAPGHFRQLTSSNRTLCCGLQPAMVNVGNLSASSVGYPSSVTVPFEMRTWAPTPAITEVVPRNSSCSKISWTATAVFGLKFRISCQANGNGDLKEIKSHHFICCGFVAAKKFTGTVTSVVENFPDSLITKFNYRTATPMPENATSQQHNDTCIRLSWSSVDVPGLMFRLTCPNAEEINVSSSSSSSISSSSSGSRHTFLCCNVVPVHRYTAQVATHLDGFPGSDVTQLDVKTAAPVPKITDWRQFNDSCVSLQWKAWPADRLTFTLHCGATGEQKNVGSGTTGMCCNLAAAQEYSSYVTAEVPDFDSTTGPAVTFRTRVAAPRSIETKQIKDGCLEVTWLSDNPKSVEYSLRCPDYPQLLTVNQSGACCQLTFQQNYTAHLVAAVAGFPRSLSTEFSLALRVPAIESLQAVQQNSSCAKVTWSIQTVAGLMFNVKCYYFNEFSLLPADSRSAECCNLTPGYKNIAYIMPIVNNTHRGTLRALTFRIR